MAIDPIQLSRDTIAQKPTRGVATWMLNIMEHRILERLAGAQPGEYGREPERVYLAAQRAVGVCMIDQYIPRNPLSMSERGFEHGPQTATQGAERIEVDGVVIDSPEAVVEHTQRYVMPALRREIEAFDANAFVAERIAEQRTVQGEFGSSMLKVPYGYVRFPRFGYNTYGYEGYFMAYALYPEVIEQLFSLQADIGEISNRAYARAYVEGDLPRLNRLDEDMADSRGTLVDIRSLDRIWFPHFARSIKPLIDVGVKLIWHCDGNLMQMVPRLLDCGLVGFQGFQYEDGMDYERICRMKTRGGDDLLIIAGVSVTTTLPHGTPDEVRQQIDWLVAHGPKAGLFLGASSSIAPGVPWENIAALVDGLRYYREGDRG